MFFYRFAATPPTLLPSEEDEDEDDDEDDDEEEEGEDYDEDEDEDGNNPAVKRNIFQLSAHDDEEEEQEEAGSGCDHDDKGMLSTPSEVQSISLDAAFEAAKRSDGRPLKLTRLCLVGEGRAGKTALANALCNRTFVETYSTVGVSTDGMEVNRTSVEALSAAWKALPSNTFTDLARQQLLWATAQQSAGSNGSGKNSIHSLYTDTPIQDRATANPSTKSSCTAKSSCLPQSSIQDAPESLVLSASSALTSLSSPADDDHVNASSLKCTKTFVAPVPRPPIDESLLKQDRQLILQLRGQSEPLRISLMDFGGQDVFYSLHHLYLTRESVYLVVFNMACMVGNDCSPSTIKQCKSYLSFWLNSIYLHARRHQEAGIDGSVAPIILVGTRKDVISSPKQHELISRMLYDEFHLSPAFKSVIPFHDGVASSGSGLLHFFPVDNRLKQSELDSVDDVVANIQACILKQLEKEDYLSSNIPLSWLRAFDALMTEKSSGRPYLPLHTVQDIAAKCGLPCLRIPDQTKSSLENEVILMLKHFHGLGLLMHHDCPKLRDIVVLDTELCLVQPASIVMCQHGFHQLPCTFRGESADERLLHRACHGRPYSSVTLSHFMEESCRNHQSNL